jgi:hypothetical protein
MRLKANEAAYAQQARQPDAVNGSCSDVQPQPAQVTRGALGVVPESEAGGAGVTRSSRSGGGVLSLAAAILVTLGLAFFALLEFAGVAHTSWPLPHVAGLVLGIVTLACTLVAAVDCWLALSGSRRRSARSYLLSGSVLLIVACLAAGPLLAVPLLPGLVLTWLAYSRRRPLEARPSPRV